MAARRKLPTTRTIAAMDKALVAAAAKNAKPPAKAIRRRKALPKEFTQAVINSASQAGFDAGYDRRRSEAGYEQSQRELRAVVESIEMMPGGPDRMLTAAFTDSGRDVILRMSLGHLRSLAKGLRDHWGFPSLTGKSDG